MSTIVFVRHSQASLFEADYDQLSESGREQAKLLGKYLADSGLVFDEVYTGPRRRHHQTANIVAEQFSGVPTVTAELSEFDEHHVDQLLSQHLDQLVAEFPELDALRKSFHAAEGSGDQQAAFARLFEAVTDLWVSGRCPLFGIESWNDFSKRVNAGIDKLVEQDGSGRKVLVFTSAGTIVASLHRALKCPDSVAMGLGWRIWNCSLTSFAFSGDRFTLDQFNSISHLKAPEHRTYR